MRVRETSGRWEVGKRPRAPQSIYMRFILLGMYVCQCGEWKKSLLVRYYKTGLTFDICKPEHNRGVTSEVYIAPIRVWLSPKSARKILS